jgi:hypothetical protein
MSKDLAARVRATRAKRTHERTSTTAPTLPTTPEGWIEHAQAKVAEHAERPPVEERRERDATSGWIALAEMIAREFPR